MIQKKLIIPVLMLLLSFNVFACMVNEPCTWYSSFNETYDSVNITIYNPQGNVIFDNQEMLLIEDNNYRFISNITSKGQYFGIIKAYNTTDLLVKKNIYYDVLEDEANINLTMIAQVLQPFLIFIIGAVLLLLGLATKERDGYVYNIFAGIWWLGSAAFMFYTGTMITSIFFVMLGVVTVFFGISKLGEE